MIIYDAIDAGRANIDVGLMGKMVPVLGAFMPETMFRLYTVNASFFVKSMYQACTSFLHPRTT